LGIISGNIESFFYRREFFALMHGINFGLGFYDQLSWVMITGKVFGT